MPGTRPGKTRQGCRRSNATTEFVSPDNRARSGRRWREGRMRGGATLAALWRPSSAQALDLADDALGAKLPQDRIEMLDVPDFQVDQHFAEIRRMGHEGNIVDVAAGFADRRRDDSQRPRLVERGDDDLGGVELPARAVDIPTDVEP